MNVTAAGQQLPAGAIWSSLSADGRFVAFLAEDSANLVPGDTNGASDVFVKNLATGAVVRASLTSAGVQGNGHCFHPRFSANGQFVSFSTFATNFAANDANGTSADVFVKDLATGALDHCSKNNASAGGNGMSGYQTISADGRFVSFYSYANNFVANDTNGTTDVFVFDRQTQSIECVSVDPAGVPVGGLASSISGDGRYVAFETVAAAIGATSSGRVIAIRDRLTGTVTPVNQLASGTILWAEEPMISADGSTVLFKSAFSFVPADTDLRDDIYAFDRATGVRTLVTPSPVAPSTTGGGFLTSISETGRFALFTSGDALVVGDTNNIEDQYLVDRGTGAIELISRSSTGGLANDYSTLGVVSANGRFVAFLSHASNLVANDTNASADIFVRDRVNAAVTQSYGAGFPGTGGVAPQLSLVGSASIGTAPVVSLTNPSATATLALVILGLQSQSVAHPAGGTLLATLDSADVFAVPANGLSFAVAIPDIIDLCNLNLYLQALVLDAGAASGIAFSQGLQVTIGG